MAICNKAGKTPYVILSFRIIINRFIIHPHDSALCSLHQQIHLETRKAAKPDWEGLEYEYQQAQPDPAHSVAPNSAKNSPERIEQDGSKGQATASGENPSAEPIPAVSNLKRSASPTTPRDDKLLKKDTRPNFLSTMKRVSQQAAVSSHINPVVDYCRPLAVEIAGRLLEECCSRKTFEDARKCLFDEVLATAETAFTTHDSRYEDSDKDHQFLELNSILECVELEVSGPAGPEPDHDGSGNARAVTNVHAEASRRASLLAIRDKNADYLSKMMIWLRDTKKVKRILRLVVHDNHEWQCRDETIEECLRGWDIRYLDWNKRDLSVDTIKGHAEKLVELWLMWSGTNTSLIGWMDSEFGLKTRLPRLERVHINVQSSVESVERMKGYLDAFQKRLKTRFDGLDCILPKDLRKGVWKDDGAGRGRTGGVYDDSIHVHNTWMEAVDGFRKEVVKSYDKLSPKSLKRGALNANPVKVAVIDDGVNPRLLNSRGIVKKGWPQPKFRRGTVEAYHKSAEGHGTKIANLIQSVCPYVHLYVAKLDKSSTHYDSMAQMAADAVDWASSQGANIISMSWTIDEKKENNNGVENLKVAIENAARKKIILFCASDDKGDTSGTIPLPASSDTKLIKKIGSCDEHGVKSSFVNSDGVDYLFPGEMLPEVSGINWRSRGKGSSASTALASGLAALILWCAEMAGPSKADFASGTRMNQLFDKLKSHTNVASLVDVTTILNDAKEAPDPVSKFIELCRDKIHEELKKSEGS